MTDNSCQYFAPKVRNGVQNDNQLNDSLNNWENYRKQLFFKMWNELNEKIEKIKSHSYTKLMEALFEFIKENNINNNYKDMKQNYGLIPTAAISLGMNCNEDKYIYDLLVENIKDLTSVVIYLNSMECKNLSFALKIISNSILNEEILEEIDVDLNDTKNYTFGMLFNIYKEHVINENHNNFCDPIVLFFEEIESFDKSLLSTLIAIIIQYIDSIPFIIVYSTSTSISLQYLLPASVTDLLLIHQFNSVPENTIVDQIINEIIINTQIPFKLGPNVLDFIVKTSKMFDSSSQSVCHLIKYALFEHFYSNPSSILCQSTIKLKKFLKNVDNKTLRNLPFISSFEKSLNGKDLKNSLKNGLEEIQLKHKRFVSQLKIIQKLVNQSSGVCIHLKQLYINASKESFDCKQVFDSLNKLTQNEWKSSLDICLTDNSLNGETLTFVNELKSYHKELCDLIMNSENEPKEVLERVKLLNIKDELSNLKTRSQWKQTINPMNKPKLVSKFELWKKITISSIEKFLRDSVIPSSHPLYKTIFFDDLNQLKRHNFVDLREDVKQTLSNPSLIVNKNKCLTTTDRKQSFPDLKTLFILYEESNSLINMYDWFTAFKSEKEELMAKNQKRKKVDIEFENKCVITRFLNAISDFEYIGLIQHSKHKTDHLMRLIWF